MQLVLQDFFIGQAGLIFGDDSGRCGAAEGIFDDLVIFGCAEQDADGRLLVGLFYVAVECFEIELEFTHVFGLELFDFEFEGDEAVKAAVKEEEVELKIAFSDLDGVVAADEAEVASKFDEKISQAFDETVMEISFGVAFGEVEEFDEVGVFEDRGGIGVQNSQRC